jgi:hypothetical protein
MPALSASDYTAYIKMKAANLAYSQPEQAFNTNSIVSATTPYSSATTITYTVSGVHRIVPGGYVTVAGMSKSSFNATKAFVNATSPTGFTITQTPTVSAGTITLTGGSVASTTVTFTAAGVDFTVLAVNQVITISGAVGGTGYNGTYLVATRGTGSFTCTAFTPTSTPSGTMTAATLTYTNTVSSVTAYATSALDSGAVDGNGLVTFTRSGATFSNWLVAGQVVAVASTTGGTGYNASFTVVTPGTTTFTCTAVATTPTGSCTGGTVTPSVLTIYAAAGNFSTILQVGQTVSFGGSTSGTQDGVFTVTGLTATTITAARGSITGISAGTPVLTYTKYNYPSESGTASYATPYTRVPISNQTVDQPVPTTSILNARVFASQMGLSVNPAQSALSSTLARVVRQPPNNVNRPKNLGTVSTSGQVQGRWAPGSQPRN